MGPTPPLSSLRLLIPPLRLMSAFMWQTAQQQNLEHYGKLVEFVTLVTKLAPEVMSARQRATLIMGLRARMILEMCRGELPADLKTVQTHLDKLQSPNLSKTNDSEVEALQANLLKLVQSLLEDTAERKHFYQEVYPVEYGPDFDKALQVLVCYFLSRLEQLLPVPNFKQAASWLDALPSVLDECVRAVSQPEHLQALLQSDHCGNLDKNVLPSIVEDRVISSLSLPPPMKAVTSCQSDSAIYSQSQPSLASERPAHDSHDTVTDDPGCQGAELSSSVDGGENDDLGEPEPQRGSEEGDERGERQNVEMRDEEKRIQPEKESDESAAGEELEISSEAPGSDTDLRRDEDGGCGTPEEAAASPTHSAAQQPKVSIPKHALTEINPSLTTPSRPTASRGNQEAGSQRTSRDETPTVVAGPDLQTTPPGSPQHEIGSEAPVSSSASHTEDGETGSVAEEAGQATAPSKTPSNRFRPPRRTAHECSQCGKRFVYLSDLAAHQRRHAAAGPHQCAQCGLGFQAPWTLAAHARRHSKTTAYGCPKCGKSFRSLREWVKHQKTHRERVSLQCPHCARQFRHLSSLENHKRTHSAGGGYACCKCDASFGSTKERLKHLEEVHRCKSGPSKPPPAKRPPGQCRFCEETFLQAPDLRSHLKTHPEFRPYQCDQCGKCFASNASLLSHLSNHTGEKPHQCAECDKRFFTKSHLKTHARSHSGERPHCCAHCGKRFTTAGNLNIHTRIHTGEKPHVCADCGKGFISAGDLQVHRRTHTGERPYQCSVCARSFVVSIHLTEHMRRHTGERPYACQECGKTFSRQYAWKSHVLTHSASRPFACALCPKSFTQRNRLKRHMQCHGDGWQQT